uniref:Shieldin complex subunit 3 n=1 Tax=Iconisemion striatum TaxID=60296 RepID=A0A1A7YLQ7_9TELE
MEDVVLYYQSGSADQLSSLVERTEKLLEPFTCRNPPAFSPWFPTSISDRRLPIRPAKPAPVITSSGDLLIGTETQNKIIEQAHKVCAETPPDDPKSKRDPLFFVSETPNSLLLVRETIPPSPGKKTQMDKDASQTTRSWSVFTQRRVLLQNSQSLSRRFEHMVSVHGLHLRQRAKWVITQDNCRDIEKVWRSLSRSVRSSRLPTCNANIQRERAEVWVFCDLLYSEQVGRHLKDELKLLGRISLSVHKLGNIFSM